MTKQLERFLTLIKEKNRNTRLNPMSAEELQKLTLARYRDPSRTETLPLPESLKALLSYDRDLTNPHGNKVFEALLASVDAQGVIHSDSPDEDVFFGAFYFMEEEVDMQEMLPIWENSPDLPALFRIMHPGDQTIWLYATELDENGEYPVARMDPSEYDFWLSESSLIEYLADIFGIKDSVDTEGQFAVALQKANERDAVLINQETIHDSFYEKMAQFSD